MDAADVSLVRNKLKEEGLTPVEVKSAGAALSRGGKIARIRTVDTAQELKRLQSGHISASEANRVSLTFFTKVHQLVENGMPLGDAVHALSQRLSVPRTKALCAGLWKELSKGTNLGGAMRLFPGIFDVTSIAMIEAGEATGNISSILENLIEMLETRRTMRKDIMSGLAYPAFILVIVFFVLLFVLFYLMPNIQTMMDSMGGELTLPTRLVMGFARLTLTGSPILAVLVIIVSLAIRQWRRSDIGRVSTDRWLVELPIVRGIALNAELCRMCNLLAVLLGSGVDTTDALRLTERAVRNAYIRGLFSASRTLINDGASFAVALRQNAVMPDMDLDILGVSEDAGDLMAGFKSIYKARNEDLREQMKRLTVWISTFALLFVFTLVALLVFGIVSSILQLSRSVLG
jgi:type II secretory pathway component PulF